MQLVPQGCLQDRFVAQLLIPSGHRSWRISLFPFSFAGVCARWTVAVLFGTVLGDPKCNFLVRSPVPGVLPSSWFGRGERDRLTRESLQLWLSSCAVGLVVQPVLTAWSDVPGNSLQLVLSSSADPNLLWRCTSLPHCFAITVRAKNIIFTFVYLVFQVYFFPHSSFFLSLFIFLLFYPFIPYLFIFPSSPFLLLLPFFPFYVFAFF